jgi:signal peptidase I
VTGEQGLSSLLAFTNPWEIVALLCGLILLRLAVAPLTAARRSRAYALEFIDSGIIAVLLIFCIVRPFFLQAFLIPSGSMHPTLLEGDRIFVNKLVYFTRWPKHGEIVVFHAPPWADPEERDFIKRVMGLPGDRISVHDGKVFRNGQPLKEPYIAATPDYEWPTDQFALLKPGGKPQRVIQDGEITVPQGMVLVMGDNRNESNDSHAWRALGSDGNSYPCPFVPEERIIGRSMFIFWPPGRIGITR